MKDDKCPCDAVEKLQEIVDSHERRLAEGSVEFKEISVKLNFVLAILGTIGVAIVGMLVSLVFKI